MTRRVTERTDSIPLCVCVHTCKEREELIPKKGLAKLITHAGNPGRGTVSMYRPGGTTTLDRLKEPSVVGMEKVRP